MNRRNAESKFNAAIHGATLKDPVKVDGKPLSEKDKKLADSSMDRMIREKQEQLARQKQNVKKGKK